MDTFELMNLLQAEEVDTSKRAGLGSSYLIRAIVGGQSLIAAGGDRSRDARVQAFVDGLHWHIRRFSIDRPMRFVLGSSPGDAEVQHAIASLHAAIGDRMDVDLSLDLEPTTLLQPDFVEAERRLAAWVRNLPTPGADPPPPLLSELATRVDSSAFQWTRSAEDGSWTGRVLGLNICSAPANGKMLLMSLGAEDAWDMDRNASGQFRRVVGSAHSEFDEQRLEAAAATIRNLAQQREPGDSPLAPLAPANRIEHLVLAGELELHVDDGAPVVPLLDDPPYRFPTLWSEVGRVQWLDLLMRRGDVPWAIEVDVPLGGLAQTMRRAIRDAVLHRHFIRHARPLAPWFTSQGLYPQLCRAAVAIPRPRVEEPGMASLVEELEAVAHALDVHLVYLDVDHLPGVRPHIPRQI